MLKFDVLSKYCVVARGDVVDMLMQRDLEKLKKDLEHAKADNSDHYIERLLAVLKKERERFNIQKAAVIDSIKKKSFDVIRLDLVLRVLAAANLIPKRGKAKYLEWLEHLKDVGVLEGADTINLPNGKLTRRAEGSVFSYKGNDLAGWQRVQARYQAMQIDQDLKKLDAMSNYFDAGEKALNTAIKWRDDPALEKERLTDGSGKLAPQKILAFNQLPGLTCPGKADCFNWCFALSGMTNMAHQMDSFAKNLGMAERDDFVEKMDAHIKRMKGKKTIRIHAYGDFHSPKYVRRWMEIVQRNPDHNFYAYTKSFYMEAMKDWFKRIEEGEFPNMKLIQSYGSKFDDKINPKFPTAKVFDSLESLKKENEKLRKQNKPEWVHCHEDDMDAADPDVLRVGIVKHGLTPCAAGFCPMDFATAAARIRHDIPIAHLVDQIDLPHHWDERFTEQAEEWGAHFTPEQHEKDFGRHWKFEKVKVRS